MKRLLLTLTITVGFLVGLNAQDYQWANFYTHNQMGGIQMTTDKAGNIHVICNLTGASSFTQNNEVIEYDSIDTWTKLILKYTPNGKLLSMTPVILESIHYTNYQTSDNSFQIDNEGNYYIGGWQHYNTRKHPNDNHVLYITKLSPAGQLLRLDSFESQSRAPYGGFFWVDQKNGDLYVHNRAEGLGHKIEGPQRLYKFDKDGNEVFSIINPRFENNATNSQTNSALVNILISEKEDLIYLVDGIQRPEAKLITVRKKSGEFVKYIDFESAEFSFDESALDVNENIYLFGEYRNYSDYNLLGETFNALSDIDTAKQTALLKYNTSESKWDWVKQATSPKRATAHSTLCASGNKVTVVTRFEASILLDLGLELFAPYGAYMAQYSDNGDLLGVKELIMNSSYHSSSRWSDVDVVLTKTKDDGLLIYYPAGPTFTHKGVEYVSQFNGNGYNQHVIAKTGDLNTRFASGNVYLDMNKNNIIDEGEDFTKPRLIIDNNENSLTTAHYGRYTVILDQTKTPKEITYSLKNTNSNFKIVPENYTLKGEDYKKDTSKLSFAIQPAKTIKDLKVTAVPRFASRPGFDHFITVSVENVGTVPIDGNVIITHSELLNFKSSKQSHTKINDSTYVFDVGTIKPLDVVTFRPDYMIVPPPKANIGDSIRYTVMLEKGNGDENPENDKVIIDREINGAYDPNIKEMNKPEIINIDDVNGSFPIEYTIHFQNTGNDTAFHVYLIDSLDEDLKVQSIEVLSASHDYEFSISENNTLRWDYYNILLVDSNTNEPESHGFIKYRVWTKDNPGLGDEFTNFADIYFDFNDPVRTNTTTNRIDKKESVQLIKGSTVIVYPNPTTDVFTVKADIKPGTKTNVEVIDLTGKVIYTENTQADANGLETKIDINTLPQGIYFIKVYAGNEVYTAKVIKQ